MTQTFILGFAQEALFTALMLAAPALGTALVVGLSVSIFQAATQIQDMTLTFVPKIVVVGLVVLALSSWMLGVILNFASKIFINLTIFTM